MAETEHPWRNKETLERLYWDEGLNQQEIADRLGCWPRTIVEWMGRHEIETRKGAPRKEYAYFETHKFGYERWQNLTLPDRGAVVLVHRLAAVAWYGFEAVANSHVHHADPEGKDRPGIPWDNRESVIELLTPGEHASHHAKRGHSISNLGGLIAQHGRESVLSDPGSDLMYCPRCDSEREAVEREWKYGPDSVYCTECGRDLGSTRFGAFEESDTDA